MQLLLSDFYLSRFLYFGLNIKNCTDNRTYDYTQILLFCLKLSKFKFGIPEIWVGAEIFGLRLIYIGYFQ